MDGELKDLIEQAEQDIDPCDCCQYQSKDGECSAPIDCPDIAVGI